MDAIDSTARRATSDFTMPLVLWLVGVLLLATIPSQEEAVAALFVLAVGTSISMAMLSSVFGWAITRGPVLSRMLAFAPAMGALTLAFGCWYTLGAVGAVPYVL